MATKYDFYIKAGDLEPAYRVRLRYSDGSYPDVTGLTPEFWMRDRNDATDTPIGGNCVVVDGTNGIIEYQWASGNTAVAGDYVGEFIVDFGGAREATFPNNRNVMIKVFDDIQDS
jgi:hypothetical protein